METDECFNLNDKNRMLLKILYDVFKEASNPNVICELKNIKEGIDLN